MLTLMYYAYAFSKIQYGIEIYGQPSKSNIKNVLTHQNRKLKILCNQGILELGQMNCTMLVKVLDISSLAISQFMHKHKSGKQSNLFKGYFKERSVVYRHNSILYNCRADPRRGNFIQNLSINEFILH